MQKNACSLNTGMNSEIHSPDLNHKAVVTNAGSLWVDNHDITAAVSDNKTSINSLAKAVNDKSTLKIIEGTNTIAFSVVGNDVIVWIGEYRMGAITFK